MTETNPSTGVLKGNIQLPRDFTQFLAASGFTGASVLAKLTALNPSERGLIEPHGKQNYGLFCAPSAAIPEFPDDPAGIKYAVVRSSFTSTGVFTYSRCTATLSGGNIIATQNDASSHVYIFGIDSTYLLKNIRIKIKSSRSSVPCTIVIQDTSFNQTPITSKTITPESSFLDGVIPTIVNPLRITIAVSGNSGDTSEILGIYFGTGAYLSKSLDLSGFGRHFNPVAVTPVPGLNGKSAFYFNRVNSHLRSEKVLDYVPDVLCLEAVFPDGNPQPAVNAYHFSYGLTAAPRVASFRGTASDNLSVSYYNGAANASVTFAGLFTGYSELPMAYVLRINFTNSQQTYTAPDGTTHSIGAYGVDIYRNGVLFGSSTMTTPSKPAPGRYLYIGCYEGASGFFTGTMHIDRMWERLITAAEAWERWKNPGAHNLDQSPRSSTAIPQAIPVYKDDGTLAGASPAYTTIAGAIGFEDELDVASGGTLTMPAGSGTYKWKINEYGVTIGGAKKGTAAAGAAVSGTASANCRVHVKRIY